VLVLDARLQIGSEAMLSIVGATPFARPVEWRTCFRGTSVSFLEEQNVRIILAENNMHKRNEPSIHDDAVDAGMGQDVVSVFWRETMVHSDADASCGEDGADGGGSHWSCVIYVSRSSARRERRNIALWLLSAHGDAIHRTPLVAKFSILIRPSIANLFSWSLG
jgi:hypothetical protein